jgi:hypothetical protein
MKTQINELKRMQQLAGIITENLDITPDKKALIQKALTTWKEKEGGDIVDGYAFKLIEPEDMKQGWSKYKSGDVAIYTKHTATDQAKLIGYFKNGEGEMLPAIK